MESKKRKKKNKQTRHPISDPFHFHFHSMQAHPPNNFLFPLPPPPPNPYPHLFITFIQFIAEPPTKSNPSRKKRKENAAQQKKEILQYFYLTLLQYLGHSLPTNTFPQLPRFLHPHEADPELLHLIIHFLRLDRAVSQQARNKQTQQCNGPRLCSSPAATDATRNASSSRFVVLVPCCCCCCCRSSILPQRLSGPDCVCKKPV